MKGRTRRRVRRTGVEWGQQEAHPLDRKASEFRHGAYERLELSEVVELPLGYRQRGKGGKGGVDTEGTTGDGAIGNVELGLLVHASSSNWLGVVDVVRFGICAGESV